MPFLKNKQSSVAGLIIKNRAPDEPVESEDPAAAIEACASALVSAIHSKDPKAVAEALKDAFAILDSMPHEEGPHIENHSYDSQNQKAAKDI